MSVIGDTDIIEKANVSKNVAFGDKTGTRKKQTNIIQNRHPILKQHMDETLTVAKHMISTRTVYKK